MRFKSPAVILTVSVLGLILASTGRFSFSIFIQPLSSEFGWSTAQVSLPFALSMLFWGAGQPVAGILSDRYGARRVIMAGLVLMGAGFLLSAAVTRLWQLSLVYGVLIGLATAGPGQPTYSLIVAKWFDERRRGLAVGTCIAASPLGSIAAAPIFYWVLSEWNWRYAFAGVGFSILGLALPLTWLMLQDPDRIPVPPRIGNVSRSDEDEGDDQGDRKEGSSGWGPALETLHLFWTPPMRAIVLSFIVCGFTGFFLSAHLAAMTREYGLSPATGAAGVAVFGIACVIGSLAGGGASDRWGRSRVLSVTYLIRALGALFLAYLVTGAPTYLLGVFLSGLPMFATPSITFTMSFELAGARRAGRVMGFVFFVHQLGATAGPYLAGLSYDLTGSYRSILLVSAVLLLLSAHISRRAQHRVHREAGSGRR